MRRVKKNWKRRARTSSRTPASARERNGRRRRSSPSPGPTRDLLRQRGVLVGEDRAQDPKAGYPLGVLCLSGVVTPRQHDAGCKFRALDARHHFFGGLPRRHPKTVTGDFFSGSGDIDTPTDPAYWEKIRAQYVAVLSAVRERASLRAHWAVIDIVLLDQWNTPYALAELRAGLDVLVEYFRVPEPR